MSWTTPVTHAVGDVLTASDWNIDTTDLGLIWGTAWTAYTVTWTAPGSNPVIGNGTLNGYYRQIGKIVVVRIYLSFGSTTTGGGGVWSFTLPVAPTSSFEQIMLAKGYCLGATVTGNYVGMAVITAGVSTIIPYLAISSTNNVVAQVQNANNAGAAGTGVPLSASYPFNTGSNLGILGVYEAA